MFGIELAPEQKTIWRVPGQPRPFIGPNDRILEIAEVRAEIVQIAVRGRVYVGSHKLVPLAKLVLRGYLKFPVARFSRVAQ